LISEEENVNASEPASYAPSWYTATMVPTAMRGPLTFDLDVDVCVIGAGLAGLTTARELARRGWSVAVLEAGRIAGAALDVLSAEPPAVTNPLLTARNCLITPHQAWATQASRARLMG